MAVENVVIVAIFFLTVLTIEAEQLLLDLKTLLIRCLYEILDVDYINKKLF